MSRFESIARDKTTVIDKILSSNEIMKALKYNELNFLEQPDFDNASLLYSSLFPHRFIPGTSDQKKTYITISFGKYRPTKTSFKSGLITFSVFTHQDLFRTAYGCLRTDYIITKLDEIFNEAEGLGVGKAEFYDMDALSMNPDYHGSYISYKVCDFN
ncbi:hypothetical protein [Paenibacillus sp. 1781tsa1]|uniref:hypothetical protein n=1 Tax=Paenibacillus sp. 1781tsa1 TaxID=2953810 RepID=UPI00209F3777|nr:hypothetical protein [Paenibacillus sp. 1781tsa1]MCP1185088.1 hypothetical protein [Paenibacillus sp. 1781tsa1]